MFAFLIFSRYNDDEGAAANTSRLDDVVDKRVDVEPVDDGDDYAPQHDNHYQEDGGGRGDEVDDEDDEVDFNLGGSSLSAGLVRPEASTPVLSSSNIASRPSAKDDG